jgi:integrase
MFLVAYTDEIRKRQEPVKGTMQSLIDMFRLSAEYRTQIGEKTRRSYNSYLRLIEDRFGTLPLEAVASPKARGKFKEWRDGFAATPRKADYAWTVLARVLSVAKDRGKIAVNVCERGGRLYESDRSEKIWTADNIRAFCAAASEELQFGLLLALWTGQRQGDLLKLSWTNYDGTHIRLRQGKTGKRVVIPAGATLKAALDARRPADEGNVVSAGPILVNSFGARWTGDGFRASWGKAFTRAKLDDLHFHDLRGTAVTRLALAGCTVPEIAAITGHSMTDAQEILDTHYMGGSLELAEAAVMKLDRKYG